MFIVRNGCFGVVSVKGMLLKKAFYIELLYFVGVSKQEALQTRCIDVLYFMAFLSIINFFFQFGFQVLKSS